ncbi:hypothetical protein [Rhizobium tumorigenes]|uniref:hypothetical protein n=1 Tax=Rhizobium tumorigenes TaxID=2041385 RepID=UPI00241FC5AC|nr:hypothetical protein [Rhizobium tumorigenes]WFS02371.1 hypothetical protein PR016_07095 [Rhizobium tumorigenes]
MKQAKLDAFWHELFGPDHEPVRVFKAGAKHRNPVGKFPTDRYAAGGVIRTRSPLMSDGLKHLDVDPRVIWLAPYPFQISYLSVDEHGEIFSRTHVPDVGIRFRNGTVGFVDYVPFSCQDERSRQREREILLHLAENFNAGYAVHDERCIYPEPIFRNVCVLREHRSLPIDHECIREIGREILEASLPMTIGELTRSVSVNAFVEKWEDEPDSAYRVDKDANPVFTACMQLAITGKVNLDLTRVFSPSTVVSKVWE